MIESQRERKGNKIRKERTPIPALKGRACGEEIRVKSEGQLERVAREAQVAGIPHYVVADAGRSEIPPGTRTVCLFGPAYRDELPKFLNGLQVMKEPPPGALEANSESRP